MEVILDKDGMVVQESRNLRGIRSYVGSHLIRKLSVDPIGHDEGKLCILFDNGCTFETRFCSFKVLCDWVARWRNVYGASLYVNGKGAGFVSKDNPYLTGQAYRRNFV